MNDEATETRYNTDAAIFSAAVMRFECVHGRHGTCASGMFTTVRPIKASLPPVPIALY